MTSPRRFPDVEALFPEIYNEDEAWAQLERDIDGSDALDMTKSGIACIMLSHTAPAARAQGNANSTSDTVMIRPNGDNGLARLEAPLPPMSANTQLNAASEPLNALFPSKAFGQDMLESNRLAQSVSSPVIRSGTELFDPNAPYGQTPIDSSNAFEDIDFGELMSHLIVSPDQDKSEPMTAGESSVNTYDTCPTGPTKTDNARVGGNGLTLRETDLERPKGHQTFWRSLQRPPFHTQENQFRAESSQHLGGRLLHLPPCVVGQKCLRSVVMNPCIACGSLA
jgi:hypothetical protein